MYFMGAPLIILNRVIYFKLSCHTYRDPHSSRLAETIPMTKPRIESSMAIVVNGKLGKTEAHTRRLAQL